MFSKHVKLTGGGPHFKLKPLYEKLHIHVFKRDNPSMPGETIPVIINVITTKYILYTITLFREVMILKHSAKFLFKYFTKKYNKGDDNTITLISK